MTDAPLLDTLTSKRAFNIFVPDVTLEDVRKNDQYVLRIQVPRGAALLGVTQIASPLAGLGVLAGSPQVAYAFLCDPDEEETTNVYVTAVFSEQTFPWHAKTGSLEPLRKYTKGGCLEILHAAPAHCEPIGITSHSGVPLLHVRVDVAPEKYEVFEAELHAAGYMVIPAKPYEQARALVEMYKASSPPSA